MSLSPLQLSSLILQWHRGPSHHDTNSTSPNKTDGSGRWHHSDIFVTSELGWRAPWQPHSFPLKSLVVFCLSIWIVPRFVTFFPPPTPCLHSVTSLFFLPSQPSSSAPPAPETRLLENPDSSDRSCAGPISWVLLTAGTHLITAETEVGGRACHSLSLDQCGPSTAVLGDGDGDGGGGGLGGGRWGGWGGGWYLSYSIASIRASADNRRLAFFVAVLRGSLAIWPEYWMNSFDFFFCLSFSTHTHTHLTFFHGHPLGLKMESKRKWNASQWESWHHVPAVSINMCRWTMGSGSKWLSDQTELKQI